MPLNSQGAGEADDSTNRSVEASDSPVTTALGATDDVSAQAGMGEASIVGVLKALYTLHEKKADEILARLDALILAVQTIR